MKYQIQLIKQLVDYVWGDKDRWAILMIKYESVWKNHHVDDLKG